MNPLDGVLKISNRSAIKRASSILVATATAGMLFFSPAITTFAAPGMPSHRASTVHVTHQDDNETQIVPTGGDDENDDDVSQADTDNRTVVIEYTGDDKGEDSSEADDQPANNQPDDTDAGQESTAPLKLKGIMAAKADLAPNQWAGVFDSRLVAPFMVAPQPQRLQSEAIGLNAPVTVREIVSGEMQTPKDEFEVTWYKETASPGEDGNMVFAGHLNWYGVPQAVFYNINQLQKGDKIVVTGETGVDFTYKVKWVKLIETADADMDQLVGKTKKPSLTLITCGGEWDAAAGQYRQRTVVRAELVSEN